MQRTLDHISLLMPERSIKRKICSENVPIGSCQDRETVGVAINTDRICKKVLFFIVHSRRQCGAQQTAPLGFKG